MDLSRQTTAETPLHEDSVAFHTHCGQCGAPVEQSTPGPGLPELVEQVALFHERSAARESVIKDLSERLEAGQDLLARHTAMPLIRRLQRLHDDLSFDARTNPDPGMSARLTTYAVEIEDLLTAESVVIETVDAGEVFDPRRHTTVGRVPTDDPALGNSIAEVLGHLYRNDVTTEVTGLARVKVYQHTAQPDGTRPQEEQQ